MTFLHVGQATFGSPAAAIHIIALSCCDHGLVTWLVRMAYCHHRLLTQTVAFASTESQLLVAVTCTVTVAVAVAAAALTVTVIVTVTVTDTCLQLLSGCCGGSATTDPPRRIQDASGCQRFLWPYSGTNAASEGICCASMLAGCCLAAPGRLGAAVPLARTSPSARLAPGQVDLCHIGWGVGWGGSSCKRSAFLDVGDGDAGKTTAACISICLIALVDGSCI